MTCQMKIRGLWFKGILSFSLLVILEGDLNSATPGLSTRSYDVDLGQIDSTRTFVVSSMHYLGGIWHQSYIVREQIRYFPYPFFPNIIRYQQKKLPHKI